MLIFKGDATFNLYELTFELAFMKCELAQHCMGFIGQQQYVISVSLDFKRQLSHLV